jgi:ferredoxin--NADP+ reductase
MYEIKRYERLTDNIFLLDVYAPRVAKKCLAGQFVIIRVDDKGERIPLTVCDFDRDKSLVTVVVQEIGATTYKTGKLRVGDCLADFVGPLGNPSELTQMPIGELKNKKVVFVAGGVGAAPVYPQVKYLHENGVKADVIVGAKNKDLLILQNELRNVAENVFVTTDDGSCGDKGLVTDKLQKLVASGKNYDLCVAIGPVIMMKFVSALTKQLGIKTVVSMNPIMVDGTGMCGACRVIVGDKVRFACVDGPEFDGHAVDYDDAMTRQRLYKTEEGRAFLKAKEGDTHHGGCGHCGGEE